MALDTTSDFAPSGAPPAPRRGISRRTLIKGGLGAAGFAGLVMPGTAVYAASEAAQAEAYSASLLELVVDPLRLQAMRRAAEEAAGRLERAGDTDAACFFLTQAYVFALEGGLPAARHLHRRLAAHGREE